MERLRALQDTAAAPAALSPARAAVLVDPVQGAGLLEGWRRGPTRDKPTLVVALCPVASFAMAQPKIESIEIHPFLVQERGGVALDALALRAP